MKKAISIFLTIFSVFAAKAQVASDALRYSYIPQYGGTARAMGVGGSMGAIGGDFSTLSTNPAGLATYRTGEFIFSPSYHGAKTTSLLANGGEAEATQRFSKFSLDNIGLVFSNSNIGTDKWKTRNFAIGFNRLQDFSSNVFYEGTTKGSVTARFRDQANNGNLDPFESRLADSIGAIYTKLVSGKRFYTSDFDLNPNAGVYKSQVIETRGRVSEMVISYAGNYNEKFQIGATIGVPFVTFTENKIYLEDDKRKEVPFFEKLEFDQNLTTTGVGVNAKIGAIIRPTKSIRLGVAVHTPTKYQMSDRYNNKLYYVYFDSLRYSDNASSPDGEFKYQLATPWRFIGSAGFILGKSGFISADVEWADYSQANFALDKEFVLDQNAVNQQITSRYKSALNMRFGGEYVYDMFRFRLGAGLNGSPRQDKNFWNTTLNAGAGIRGRHFYMDLAWQQRTQKENYTPYKVITSQADTELKVTNAYVFNDYVLTFGIKF
jgi:hypothetical protein